MPTIPTLAVRASILARKSLAFAVEETLVAVDIARNYSIRMRQWPGRLIATHTKVTSLFCGFLGVLQAEWFTRLSEWILCNNS